MPTSFPAFTNHGLKPTPPDCGETLLKAIAPKNQNDANELLAIRPERFSDLLLALKEETKQLPLVYMIDLKQISVGSTEWKTLACVESWARSAYSSLNAAPFKMPSNDMVTLALRDGKTVQIQRNTLVFQSDYFCKMLLGGLKEGSTLEVECKEFSPAAYRHVITYLQLGDHQQYLYRMGESVHCKWAEMDVETVFDMMLLADMWVLPLLKERCEKWIAKEAAFEVDKAPSLLWKLPERTFPLLGELSFAVDYLRTVVHSESNRLLGEARALVKSKPHGWLSVPICQQPEEKPTQEKIEAFISLMECYPDFLFSIHGSFSTIDEQTLPILKKLRASGIIAMEQAGKCLQYELGKLGIPSQLRDASRIVPKLYIKYPPQLDNDSKIKAEQLLEEYKEIPIQE